MSLLSPELERQLAGMVFPLKHSVRSRLLGQHRSPQAGASIEFSEHKEYAPGDDIRHVNWKLYGRLDRFFVKQFNQDASARTVLMIDISGSMRLNLGEAGEQKLTRAAEIAAALAYVLLRQGDQVGLVAFRGSEVVLRLPPHRHPAHYHQLVERLLNMLEPDDEPPRGDGRPPLAALHLAEAERWHDTAILFFSDLLFPPDELFSHLDGLRQRNNRTMLYQIIHPAEYEPEFKGGVPVWDSPAEGSFPYGDLCRFRSPETGQVVLADPRVVRREYLARYSDYISDVHHSAAECRTGHLAVSTAEQLDRFLLRHLAGG